jgi:hypothetical protein
MKPKVASTLAYLSQTMIQSIPIAQHEYCEAFSSDSWRKAIRSSFHVPAPPPKPATQAAPPAPSPTAFTTTLPTKSEAHFATGASTGTATNFATSATSGPQSQ